VFVAVAVSVGVNVAVAVAVGVCIEVIVGVKVLVGMLVFVGVKVLVTVGVGVLKNPPKLLALASHASKISKRRMTMIVMITFGFIFTLLTKKPCHSEGAFFATEESYIAW